MQYKSLFESVTINKLVLANRFAMCAMGPMGLGDKEGGFIQRGRDYYVERAKGGTGLIITGVTHPANDVEVHEYPSTPSATINPAHFIRTTREMTERIHAYGSYIFLQESAGFGRVFAEFPKGELPVAPSPIQNRFFDVTCRPITIDEIHSITRQIAEGAAIAQEAGFDGVQIHAVHEGYLLDQFAISFFNQREDEYGGSLANRLRFAREVVEAIKAACGQDFPVTMRYTPKSFIKDWRKGALPGEDFVEKGRDIEEGIETARLLADYGYDAFDVDVGSYDAWWWNHPPMYQKKGLYREYSKLIKAAVDVPVICAGRMDDPDMAAAAIADGTCDIIGLARPLLADPHYVNKLRHDDAAAIRPCLSCHEGCMGRMIHYKNISCAVNPTCARERYTQLTQALTPRQVLIVGGGPAGMETARVCAERGHKVRLYEAGERLGGNLIPGGVPDFKEDDHALIRWYEEQLSRVGVEIHLNTALDAAAILKQDFDHLVIATGSTPKIIPFGEGAPVVAAEQVLLGEVEVGNDIVIMGGGLVGCETALWLAEAGKQVTVVELLDDVLKLNGPLCPSNFEMLKALLPYKGVRVLTSSSVAGYADGAAIIQTPEGEERVAASAIIECVGYAPVNDLYEELRFEVPSINKLGDSLAVSNIMNAIWAGYELGSSI